MVVAAVLLACNRHESPVVTPLPAHGTTTAMTAAANPPVSTMVWRVLNHVFVEDEAGVVSEMSVTIQLEVGGQPPKTDKRTLGTFHATAPLDEAIVAADGGNYSAY